MAWDIRSADGSVKQVVSGSGAAYAARVFRNTAPTAISNATWTTVPFDNEQYDSAGLHDNVTNNSRLTAPVAGVYKIDASIGWAANVTGDRLARLRVNGTTVIASSSQTTNTALGLYPYNTLSGSYYLNTGDYVELQVYQTSGGSLGIVGTYTVSDLANPYFSMVLEQTALINSIFDAPTANLPAAPTDGQVVLYQSSGMATDGIVWTLRYRESSPSSYKWEYIGGGSLASYGAGGNISTAGITTYADPAGGTSSITVPLAGDYSVDFGARMVNNSNGNQSTGRLGLNVGGSIQLGVEYKAGTVVNEGQATSANYRSTGAAASTIFKVQGSTVGGINTNVYSPYLLVTPIRVG